MVIGIDIRVLLNRYRSGIDEYTVHLLSHLLPLDTSIKYKLFISGFQKPQFDFSFLSLPNVNLYYYKTSNRFLMNPLQFLFDMPKIDSLLGGIDIFFSPHLFMPVSLSRSCSYIATVHDLAFLHFPEFFPINKKMWHTIETRPKRQLKKANHVITVSNSTKNDLIHLYTIDPEKISVIYSGILQSFVKKSAKKEFKNLTTGNFILSLGTIEPRKNILGLLKAYEILRQTHKRKEKLVVAGNPGWLYKEIFVYAQQSRYAKDIIFTGAVSEEKKQWLYTHAAVFVYPSFFEGFGFPPLEAMAATVPVVTSNTSSLPEVVADAALTVNPYSPQEIATSIHSILTDSKLRTVLKQRGMKNISRFSWKKCAESTLKVITEGIKQKTA